MFRYQYSTYHGCIFRTNLATNRIDAVYDEYSICSSNASNGSLSNGSHANTNQLGIRNCVYCLPYFMKVDGVYQYRIGYGHDQEVDYGDFSGFSRRFVCYKSGNSDKKKNEELENAVILSDIPKCWTANEGSTTPSSHRKSKKPYDDVDFNLSTIFEESQKYNDCSFVQKRNILFLNAIKEHLKAYYLTNTKFNLVLKDVNQIFSKMSLNDQCSLFGYDAIVNSGRNDFFTSSRTVEDNIIVKNMKELAVTFGIEFSYINTIISACDEYFEKSGRKRMAYTETFQTKK